MLGQYATSGASSVDSRIFVYEVTGLAQNDITESHESPIRNSHSQFIQVPFHRMNEVSRWVTLLGGKIVTVRPLNTPESA